MKAIKQKFRYAIIVYCNNALQFLMRILTKLSYSNAIMQ